jgi:signal peptidase I
VALKTKRAPGKQKGAAGSLIELVTIVAVALGLALGIQAFLVKPFRIPSESMVPTLEINQRVLVDRVTGHFGDYELGDVLVFKPPSGAENEPGSCGDASHSTQSSFPCPRPTAEKSDTNFIKRVVAVGGDRIRIVRGSVYRNGKRQDEPFARLAADCDVCNMPEEITVPKDHYFMMGDNRGSSLDSRVWGPVPKKWVIGQAFATYWPPKRIGTL